MTAKSCIRQWVLHSPTDISSGSTPAPPSKQQWRRSGGAPCWSSQGRRALIARTIAFMPSLAPSLPAPCRRRSSLLSPALDDRNATTNPIVGASSIGVIAASPMGSRTRWKREDESDRAGRGSRTPEVGLRAYEKQSQRFHVDVESSSPTSENEPIAGMRDGFA